VFTLVTENFVIYFFSSAIQSSLSSPTISTALVPFIPDESQTQDETEFVIPRHTPDDHKRKSASSSSTEVQPNKKIKISIGPAVDLQD